MAYLMSYEKHDIYVWNIRNLCMKKQNIPTVNQVPIYYPFSSKDSAQIIEVFH